MHARRAAGTLNAARLPHPWCPAINRARSMPCGADAQEIHKVANRNCGQQAADGVPGGGDAFVTHPKKPRKINGLR